jgi:hypothetical protein
MEDGEVQGAPERREDWTCVSCDDHQFGRTAFCRRCGSAKPTAAATRAYLAKKQQQLRRLDWTCVSCDDIQSARDSRCKRCGKTRPSADAERRYLEQKRAQAEAQVVGAQRRTAEAAARRQLEAAKFAEHVRRLSAPGWPELRLLFIGALDEGSVLSRLPPEMVVTIARWSLVVPTCSASHKLTWFKHRARADSTSTTAVKLSGSDSSGAHEDAATKARRQGRNYILEYDQNRTRPTHKRFTLYWWDEERQARDAQEYWSEGMFLAKASYDPFWREWLTWACLT